MAAHAKPRRRKLRLPRPFRRPFRLLQRRPFDHPGLLGMVLVHLGLYVVAAVLVVIA
ncbi:hypothetical protein [Saccharothrix texasensis]|uniref:Uncharacterized protein n=1 Tax=Saccharothrix texasensis TaxID=103734 RepID=A0A3N1H1A2_9PSEU|nr:hypothetical protein [Saccharothrix texasensis]ROP36258.1 hypothetical protein EDD40_1523 [Saccharothrix texasensis]